MRRVYYFHRLLASVLGIALLTLGLVSTAHAQTKAYAYDQGNSLSTPAPVGCCPAGVAACGALDMAGNVWEYCRSSHAGYPAQSGEAEKDFTDYEADVPVRGGSWYHNSTSVRCGTRDWGVPHLRYGDDGGFRLVLVPRVRTSVLFLSF